MVKDHGIFSYRFQKSILCKNPWKPLIILIRDYLSVDYTNKTKDHGKTEYMNKMG